MTTESTEPSTSTDETMSTQQTPVGIDSLPDPDQLTEKQLETLHAIRERPEATQRELAEILGVSAPTVSQRVNSIEGFEWGIRQLYVNTLFEEAATAAVETAERIDEDDSPANEESITEPATNGASTAEPATEITATPTDDNATQLMTDGNEYLEPHLCQLGDRIDHLAMEIGELHQQFDAAATPKQEAVTIDPELTHKVLHACLQADYISEDEELRLVQDLLGGS